MGKEFIRDIVCSVLAQECSVPVIESVLNAFLPNWEKLNLDYTHPPDDENYEFKSQAEMLQFFIDHKAFAQDFYWNKKLDNPDRIMVGASITADNHLVISLTFNGNAETEEKYFTKLKSLLNSDIGVISYISPAEYENGADFKQRYG